MSYKKMMKRQKGLIKRQKSKSYNPNIICHIPSDSEIKYPVKTSNIEDYCTEELTAEQIEIAKELMMQGFKGQPFFNPNTDNLKRNLFSIPVKLEKRTVTAVQHNFGFDFSY